MSTNNTAFLSPYVFGMEFAYVVNRLITESINKLTIINKEKHYED